MEEDKNTLDLHTEVREEDRVAKAVALFKEGYNCSQSVVTAFADLYGSPVNRPCTCPPLSAAA